MTTPESAPIAYLDPVRAAAAERALEQAEARIETLLDTLAKRSDAVNRVGATNDTLRATLARVQKVSDGWKPNGRNHLMRKGVCGCAWCDLWRDLNEALTSQEPNA